MPLESKRQTPVFANFRTDTALQVRGTGTPRRMPRIWRTLQLLIAGSKSHAFLDRAWIPWMLKLTPRRLRTELALRLLGYSNHYWIYQWGNYYSADLSRGEVLKYEYIRNAESRAVICDKILKRYLRPDMTVLDFGCGPGFLAREAAAHVKQVIGSDVSRGVCACARVLNPADNLKYITNGHSDLALVADASIDLVYSFAVLQHLQKENTQAYFKEFARILKPKGTGACHTIIRPENAEKALRFTLAPKSWRERRVNLRMENFTASEMTKMLNAAGFADVRIVPIGTLTDIDDDIVNEHLVLFGR